MSTAEHIFINNTQRTNDDMLPASPPEDGVGYIDLEFSFDSAFQEDGTYSTEFVPDNMQLTSMNSQGTVDVRSFSLVKREKQEEYFDEDDELRYRIGYEDFRLRLKIGKNPDDEYKESKFILTLITWKFDSEHTDHMSVMEEGSLTFSLTLLADVDMGDAPEIPPTYDPEDEEQAEGNAEAIAEVQDEVAEKVSSMLSAFAPPIDINALLLPILLVKSGGNVQIANVMKQLRDMRLEVRRLKVKADIAHAKKEELSQKASDMEMEEWEKYMEEHKSSSGDPFEPSYKVGRLKERSDKAGKDEELYQGQYVNAMEEYKAFVRLHILSVSEVGGEEESEIRGKYPSGTNIFVEDMTSAYGEDVMEWGEEDIDRGVKEFMLRDLVTGGLGRMVKEKLNRFKQQFAAVASGVKDLMTTAQTTFMEPMGAVVATPTGPGSVAANIPQVFNSLKRLNAAAASLVLPITDALESARFLGLPKEVVTPLVRMSQILIVINEIAGRI